MEEKKFYTNTHHDAFDIELNVKRFLSAVTSTYCSLVFPAASFLNSSSSFFFLLFFFLFLFFFFFS
jgi:hypothetical protein